MSLAPFRQSALVRSLNIFNPPNCQTFDSTFGFYRLFCSFKFYELHLFYSFRSLFGGIFFQQLKRLESKIRNVKNKFYDSIAMLCKICSSHRLLGLLVQFRSDPAINTHLLCNRMCHCMAVNQFDWLRFNPTRKAVAN